MTFKVTGKRQVSTIASAPPKKYEEIAEDLIWLKQHPDQTASYRKYPKLPVLSEDLPPEVRQENYQRLDIMMKCLKNLPKIIEMKYDTYKLNRQLKQGKITTEQFNHQADSLGLPYKGPGGFERYNKRTSFFKPSNQNKPRYE